MDTPTDPQELVAAMPYSRVNGVMVDEARADLVTGRIRWSPERTTAGGDLHGSALLTLADSLGQICALLNLPPGAGTTTLGCSSQFFRGIRGGDAHATTRPIHVGRRTLVVQTDIRDDDGRPVAQMTQTQAVLVDALPMGALMA
ncbi:MAG: PaaI family thioesterase [Candidatus Dormiibacterota bacterium]